MKVTVLYFAQLREKTSLSKEDLSVEGSLTVRDLYRMMDKKYSFQIEESLVKYAINDSYVEETAVPNENDEIVFITPVAGG